MDFEKAFDKVPRELLWMRLEERGVTGAILDALKACYRRVELKVHVNRVLGDSFFSFQGVKQGCPMSPTLYGIFGEGFADYVEAKDHLAPDAMAAHDCPISDDVRIPLKLYADDLSLFAASHRRLMALLRSLREWCEAFGMSMNAGKCEVLYFHSDKVICKAMYTLGEYGLVFIMVKERGVQVMKSLPWKDRARYLGLHYGPGTTFESCTDKLYASGQRALFSLVSKLRRQGLFVPAVAVRAFDAQVRSILSYGVQVWGPAMVLQVLERGYPSNQGPRSCNFEYALQNRMV